MGQDNLEELKSKIINYIDYLFDTNNELCEADYLMKVMLLLVIQGRK